MTKMDSLVYFLYCDIFTFCVILEKPALQYRNFFISLYIDFMWLNLVKQLTYAWYRGLDRYMVLSNDRLSGFDIRTGMAILIHSIFILIHFWQETPEKCKKSMSFAVNCIENFCVDIILTAPFRSFAQVQYCHNAREFKRFPVEKTLRKPFS